ncbi:oligopeptide/dipeptide ABC transporter ATP-binding protein [Nonomuraea sp. NPDC048892]|uniref:oligopeptide/dipeptide ABC transporter ATP-binding protein n=1 Tax=Nonomuraea sp. NPDC048892 TaxID=3154624 RepID=UPI00340C02DF
MPTGWSTRPTGSRRRGSSATRSTSRSTPPLHGPLRELRGIPGSPPDLRALPAGCAFQPRCQKRQPECSTTRPELPLAAEHGAACLLAQPADLPGSKAVR